MRFVPVGIPTGAAKHPKPNERLVALANKLTGKLFCLGKTREPNLSQTFGYPRVVL